VTEALVSTIGVTKTFHHLGRPLEVLRGIDLEIGQGELVAVVGPSGAGKSTLLHCIGTLDTPTSGEIRIAGQDTTKLRGTKLNMWGATLGGPMKAVPVPPPPASKPAAISVAKNIFFIVYSPFRERM
jgi:ABC-type transporter Mla maintaining outer membrane lipid asymmetry ATPase subunit MlaF